MEFISTRGTPHGYDIDHPTGIAAPPLEVMVTHYLADHRSIFGDDTRRAAPVEIPRLFSDVGWSDALKAPSTSRLTTALNFPLIEPSAPCAARGNMAKFQMASF